MWHISFMGNKKNQEFKNDILPKNSKKITNNSFWINGKFFSFILIATIISFTFYNFFTHPIKNHSITELILCIIIGIKNSIFRNSLIFQGLPPIKYQNLMYFPLFLPL